jgi:LacI family transcriptional regulator
MTIKHIAEQAHVSISTVSRVLNGKPDVNPETRSKVLEVIDKLKFRPSGTARNLALQRTNVIGFLVRDIADANFPELAKGIVAAARDRNCSVMFFDTELNPELEAEATRVMESKEVDGIIVPFFDEGLEELQWLHKQGLPLVRIYREDPHPEISTIAIDNVASGITATEHLISLGHRRIAHLTRDLSAFSGRERLSGYREAMQRHGLPVPPEYTPEEPPTREGGYRCMQRLLALDERPTAVFASKDLMAIGAYEAILDAGLRIPEDISIVGHDDIPAATVLRPKLTTITTFRHRLGNAAVELLFEEMETGPRAPKEVFFTPQLVLRESSTVAPADS